MHPIRSIRRFILKGESAVQSLTALLKNPLIKQVITLGLRFREMIKGNPKQWSLENWIKQAMECDSKSHEDICLWNKSRPTSGAKCNGYLFEQRTLGRNCQ